MEGELQLMNDNAAMGVNYGMFRRKIFNESATHTLVFDMGATKTTATVYEYQVHPYFTRQLGVYVHTTRKIFMHILRLQNHRMFRKFDNRMQEHRLFNGLLQRRVIILVRCRW